MKISANARFANSLIIAIVFLVFAMVLHPTGGSIVYVQKISTMLMVTHALAILSVPFWILGFWGLSRQLEDDSLIALTAFITICVGLFAVVLAAGINGLALPLFLNHYLDASPEKINAIKPFFNYNTALNHAFDFIYMGASCLATLLWSIAILKTRKLPVWIGWFGIVFLLLAIVPMFLGFSFTDLTGFRIFVSGYAIWTILIIISLHRKL